MVGEGEKFVPVSTIRMMELKVLVIVYSSSMNVIFWIERHFEMISECFD